MADSATPAALPPVGAYGLRLENVERARPLLVPAPLSWPRLTIRRRVGRTTLAHDWLTSTDAALRLQNGGEIRIDRLRGLATFVAPERLQTAAIVHPLLAPVAAVMAYWGERESFHAGAYVAGGRVWGVLGERGTGKSTVMAGLALGGAPVVADDLLVLEGARALPGPRSVDLRRTAAEVLGVGEPLGVVGARERWRFRLEPLRDGTTELGGWVFLEWGDRFEAAPARAAERLLRLTRNRGTQLPVRDQDRLLEFASRPGWIIRRPRAWSSLPETLDWLSERGR